MATREEIREGMAIRLGITGVPSKEHWDMFFDEKRKAIYFKWADQLLSYLHSEGVVIKVNREFKQDLWMPLGGAYVNANGTWINKAVVNGIMDLATDPLIEG